MHDGSTALSFDERVERGKTAQQALRDYRKAMKENDESSKIANKTLLDENMNHFGYGFLKDAKESIPPVGITFYSFHIMVLLGMYFIAFFAIIWFLNHKDMLSKMRWIQFIAVVSIPLAYITSEAGWVIAEVGRQPWTIQDVLPAGYSVSNIPTASVKTTFFVFLAVFTALFIAEIKIMLRAIKNGPSYDEN